MVTYLLVGLGPEYDSFVTSVTTHLEPLSLKQIYGHLLLHESRLKHHSTTITSSINMSVVVAIEEVVVIVVETVVVAVTSTTKEVEIVAVQLGVVVPLDLKFDLCQICFKIGHTAFACDNHFNQAFQQEPLAHMAYYSSSSSSLDAAWYPDTATTSHLTSDLSHLNIQSQDYLGDEQLRVGDGTTLPIHHIDTSLFKHSHCRFLLHSLLHVPAITKNLMSVRQFCEDNNIFFQFHSNSFSVKDFVMETTLLQGSTRDGLYVFPSSVLP